MGWPGLCVLRLCWKAHKNVLIILSDIQRKTTLPTKKSILITTQSNGEYNIQCLMASSQFWIIIKNFLLHWSESNFTRSAHELNPYHVFEIYTVKIKTTSSNGQWVKINFWRDGARQLSTLWGVPYVCVCVFKKMDCAVMETNRTYFKIIQGHCNINVNTE